MWPRDARRISALVAAGVDVNSHNEYGQSALFLAAWHGNVAAVVALLAAGGAAGDDSEGGNDFAGVSVSALLSRDPPWTPAARANLAVAASTLGLSMSIVPSSVLGASVPSVPAITPSLRVLIAPHMSHPGSGSFILDGAFPEAVLARLTALQSRLPVAGATKPSCSQRTYYCDSMGWVQEVLAERVANCDFLCTCQPLVSGV